MKRVLSIIGLWLVSVAAFAGSAASGGLSPISFPNNSTPPTDLSLHYLSELFGNIPHVLAGDGSGMMGHLFYALNQGILVVAGVWLVYTIFNILLRSGLEGTLHGPTVKTAYALFRIAVGLCLVLPSSTTGYSAIQDVMMKVVVEGVNLADETWSYALNYMQNGGMLYTSPSVSKDSYKGYQIFTTGKNSTTGIVKTVLNDEMNMYASNVYMQKPQNKNNYKNVSPYKMVLVPPKVKTVGTKSNATVTLYPGAIKFPGIGKGDQHAKNNNSGEVEAYPASPVVLEKDGKSTGGASDLANYQTSYHALVQMAEDLRPLAQQVVNYAEGTGSAPSAKMAGQTIGTSVLDYMHLIMPYARNAANLASKGQKDFIADAKDEGWLGAGNFYWDLANLNDSLNSAVKISTYVPTSKFDPDITQVKDILGGAKLVLNQGHVLNIANAVIGSVVNDTVGTNSAAKNQQVNIAKGEAPVYTYRLTHTGLSKSTVDTILAAQGDPATAVNNSYDTGGVDFDSIIQDALGGVINTVSQVEMNANNSAFYDPLMFVQEVGKACLSAAGSIWAQSIGWMIGFAAISGICASMMPGANITQVMSSWLTPLWQASAGALFAAGFMMTFYTPLYPYLLFTFGVIGWIISVIEAMVAAPLVAFGMTHPEGHDFLGRAEQALMLALGVFLRPVLMVIGYLSAIILSYIGFAIVNFSFGQVLVSSFTASSGTSSSTQVGLNALPAIWDVVNGSASAGQSDHFTGHDLSDFLLIPLLMIGYGLILIEVVNQCFSLIHVLPDMVLRWIGGPVQQDMSERYASQVQSGLSGSAKQGGQVAGQGATGFGGAMGGMVVQPAVEQVANSGLTASADSLSSGGSGGSAGAEGGEGGADALALMA